jgi:hypothetical protein
VEVLKSTGYEVLDQSAIAALRQWRFKLRGVRSVRVPINFKMSEVRHRMFRGEFDLVMTAQKRARG